MSPSTSPQYLSSLLHPMSRLHVSAWCVLYFLSLAPLHLNNNVPFVSPQVSRALYPIVVGKDENDETNLTKKALAVGFEQGYLMEHSAVILVSGINNALAHHTTHTMRILDAVKP